MPRVGVSTEPWSSRGQGPKDGVRVPGSGAGCGGGLRVVKWSLLFTGVGFSSLSQPLFSVDQTVNLASGRVVVANVARGLSIRAVEVVGYLTCGDLGRGDFLVAEFPRLATHSTWRATFLDGFDEQTTAAQPTLSG